MEIPLEVSRVDVRTATCMRAETCLADGDVEVRPGEEDSPSTCLVISASSTALLSLQEDDCRTDGVLMCPALANAFTLTSLGVYREILASPTTYTCRLRMSVHSSHYRRLKRAHTRGLWRDRREKERHSARNVGGQQRETKKEREDRKRQRTSSEKERAKEPERESGKLG